MDDNLYPNGGAPFLLNEPIEQKQDRAKEKAEVLSALPIVKKILDHLDERIAFRDSIKSIAVDITVDPALHQKICAVNDLLADALKEERDLLESLLEDA